MTHVSSPFSSGTSLADPAAIRSGKEEGRDGQVSKSRGFVERLVGALRTADQAHRTAEHESLELARGEGDVVRTMVALSKADLSLRMAVNVRNRALEAYQEIMRLPI